MCCDNYFFANTMVKHIIEVMKRGRIWIIRFNLLSDFLIKGNMIICILYLIEIKSGCLRLIIQYFKY